MADSLQPLHADLKRAGYYPELLADCLDLAIGPQSIVSYLVHPETTFDAMSVHRHVSVLVLTTSRLIVAHVDDFPDPSGPTAASASTEIVPLSRITSVVVAHHVEDPAAYRPGGEPSALTIAIGWGAVRRLELDPATCADPDCEADHGLTGTASLDDVVLRISDSAQGDHAVGSALSFARALIAATA